MTTRTRTPRRGQALLMAALMMAVLLSMIALALDVGWAFYSAKKLQTAADAAAIAAVTQAANNIGTSGTPVCGGTVDCQAAANTCPEGRNLSAACKYAAANGLTQGGEGGRQTIEVSSGIDSFAPSAPDIPVKYWVKVTGRTAMPQWFSRMFSATGLTPTATATAALREQPLTASMHLLNRSNDCFVSALNIGLVCGEDLLTLGGNTITAPGGIYMSSSNGAGIGLPKIKAGVVVGSLTVNSPFTFLMGKGAVGGLLDGILGGLLNPLANVSWDNPPQNGFPDSEMFRDPMAGKGQPPVPSNLPARPVPGGVITGSLPLGLLGINPPPRKLPPGHYYATIPATLLTPEIATGLPVTIVGSVEFSDGAANPCGGFCEYVFHGGLVTAALSDLVFSPGRYVFAGAKPVAGGPGVGLTVGVGSRIYDRTPLVNGEIGPPNDAGEIFIFTDSNYPGLQLPVALQNAGISLPQARAGVTALGLEPEIILHGLNKSHPALPQELQKFAPALIWQDQANTTVKYTASGTIDLTCGGACPNLLAVPGSQEMIMLATQRGGKPGAHLYGTIYGPRQSWTTIVGLLPGDTIEGPMQFITGALQMTLNTHLAMKQLPQPMSVTMSTLIR